MKFKSIGAAAAIIFATATAGSAAVCGADLGDVTVGASCTDSIAVKTIDWIDFSLDAPDGFRVSSLDITVTTVSGSNFNPVLAVYSGTSLVDSTGNYGGAQGVPLTLSLNGATALDDGSYTLGIGARSTFFLDPKDGSYSTAFFNNGNYSLAIETTLSQVPLPAGGLMVLTGLGAFAVARRKQR